MATEQPAIQNRCDHFVLHERLEVFINSAEDVAAGSPVSTVGAQYMIIRYPVFSPGAIRLFRFGYEMPDDAFFVVDDPGRSLWQDTQYRYKLIFLKNVERSSETYYEVDYQTAQQFCDKCSGTGETDDFAHDGTGKPVRVTLTNQLAQDVEKAVRTELGSNKYHPWVGSKLHSLIGSKVTDESLLISDVRTYVRESLKTLQETQIAQANMNSRVSADEILGSVNNIGVEIDAEDPSVVRVSVDYTSKSGRVLNFTGEIAT